MALQDNGTDGDMEIIAMTSNNSPPIEQPVDYTSGLFDD